MSGNGAPDSPPAEASGWVTVGRVNGLFGVNGGLRLYSYMERPADLLTFDRLWLVTAEGRKARRVLATERKGPRLMAFLEGVADREAARALLGAELEVPRSELGEAGDGELLWADLIGLAVETLDGVSLGRVDSLVETGANDVLVVAGADRMRLVPFLAEYVPEVDLPGGVIRVDWDPDF